MPAVLTAPAAPDPDDHDPGNEFITEHELRERGIDPALVRIICPWATEQTGHGGVRCWAVADLLPLLEGNP